MPSTDHAVRTVWPSSFDPHRPGAGGFAVREVAAPADAVFAWVRRPDLHPTYYRGMKLVRSLGGPWPQLDVGSRLTFTLGATFIPFVQVSHCDPDTRSLAWVIKAPGFSAAHAFTVVELGPGRAAVRSEELWTGPVARATALLTRGPIQTVQTRWASAIAAAATEHPAGPPTR